MPVQCTGVRANHYESHLQAFHWAELSLLTDDLHALLLQQDIWPGQFKRKSIAKASAQTRPAEIRLTASLAYLLVYYGLETWTSKAIAF